MTTDFHQISITGRYIYCYLCLKKVIESKSLDDIPNSLDVILKQFTNSSKLDDWQDGADDVMPSRLLNDDDNTIYKVISQQQALNLRIYYLKNELAKQVIELLLWVGISDLYVAFDTRRTFDCVKEVVEILNNNNIDLPEFSIISSCSVNELDGWGKLVNIDDFLVGNESA